MLRKRGVVRGPVVAGRPLSKTQKKRITQMSLLGAMERRRVALAWLPLAAVLVFTGCDTQSKPILRQSGWEAIQEGRWEQADTDLTQALQADPADWRANFLLGKVRLHQGRPLAAQLLLEQAMTLHPRGPESGQILDAMAESLYDQGQKAALTEFLDRTAQQRKGVEDFLRQAKYLAKLGDPDGALKAYRMGCEFAPKTDPTPYLALADYYQSLGDTPRAIKALRYAYYIEPHDPGLNDKLRALGVVPGPTFGLPPVGVPMF